MCCSLLLTTIGDTAVDRKQMCLWEPLTSFNSWRTTKRNNISGVWPFSLGQTLRICGPSLHLGQWRTPTGSRLGSEWLSSILRSAGAKACSQSGRAVFSEGMSEQGSGGGAWLAPRETLSGTWVSACSGLDCVIFWGFVNNWISEWTRFTIPGG